MLNHFPPPSDRTDRFALRVVEKLDEINEDRDFMISVGELDDHRFVVGLSGLSKTALLAKLYSKLRSEELLLPYPAPLSSLNAKMLNGFEGRKYGWHYVGERNCSEPKLIECARNLRKRLIAMTTVWYGTKGNRAWRKGYEKYKESRQPLGGVRIGQLNFAKPCEVCQANERRLMLYLEEGFPSKAFKPKFGSYEAPF
ncbi:MAG: hypothetical protein RLZZ143_3386 [Cyanobacteriota bacterium]|jgi:hypothetical protein